MNEVEKESDKMHSDITSNCWTDPDYDPNAIKLPKFRKFLVKSDVMKFRNIAMVKYLRYSNYQQLRKQEYNTKINEEIYQSLHQIHNFYFDYLEETRRRSFFNMRQTQQKLQFYQNNYLRHERIQLILKHQEIYSVIIGIYDRFCYLIKLIDYFDILSTDITSSINNNDNNHNNNDNDDSNKKFKDLIKDNMLEFMKCIPAKHGSKEIKELQEYRDKLIRPYLQIKNYCDKNILQKGYESIQLKVFNYNRHLMKISTLDHMISIIYKKFTDKQCKLLKMKHSQKNPIFHQERFKNLRIETIKLFENFEENQKLNKTKNIVFAIVPIIIRKLNSNKTTATKQRDVVIHESQSSTTAKEKPLTMLEDDVLIQIGQIQDHLLNLLNKLDSKPSIICSQIENKIRKAYKQKLEIAKQSLIKQIRFNNLTYHYKYHHTMK